MLGPSYEVKALGFLRVLTSSSCITTLYNVFSTMEESHEYHGGYLEYCGGYSVPWGISWWTWGIPWVPWGHSELWGDAIFCYLSSLTAINTPPWTVLMISPMAPKLEKMISPQYWTPPWYSWYPPRASWYPHSIEYSKNPWIRTYNFRF